MRIMVLELGCVGVMTRIKYGAQIRSAKCEISPCPLVRLPRNLHFPIISHLHSPAAFSVHRRPISSIITEIIARNHCLINSLILTRKIPLKFITFHFLRTIFSFLLMYPSQAKHDKHFTVKNITFVDVHQNPNTQYQALKGSSKAKVFCFIVVKQVYGRFHMTSHFRTRSQPFSGT